MAFLKDSENILGKTAASIAETSNKDLEMDMECGTMFLRGANATRDITCSTKNTATVCMIGEMDTSTKAGSLKINVVDRDNYTTTMH